MVVEVVFCLNVMGKVWSWVWFCLLGKEGFLVELGFCNFFERKEIGCRMFGSGCWRVSGRVSLSFIVFKV